MTLFLFLDESLEKYIPLQITVSFAIVCMQTFINFNLKVKTEPMRNKIVSYLDI